MQGDFQDIWDEMDILMEQLMGRGTGFGTLFSDLPSFGESGDGEIRECTGDRCTETGAVEPRVEVHREEGILRVVTELPGADADTITLDPREDTLVIEATAGTVQYRAGADISGAPKGPMESSFRNSVLEVTFREAAAA